MKFFHSALLRRMPNPQAGFKAELEGMVVLLNTVALVLAQLVVVCVVTVVVVVIPPGDVCEAVEDVVATTGEQYRQRCRRPMCSCFRGPHRCRAAGPERCRTMAPR